MLPVYSTAFVRERNFGATATYVVPPGYTVVVKQISAYNGSLGAEPPWVSVSGGVGETIWNAHAPVGTAADTWYAQIEGSWVLLQGETLTVVSSGSNDVYVGGYLLTNA